MARAGIGTLRERSLHARLKRLYAEPGDLVEEKVEGYWVDIRRGDEVIEIQTGNFGGMKRKLAWLLESRPVRVVHPVAAEKWITRLAADGSTVVARRKSPKRGTVYDLFDELVSFPQFSLNPRFSIEVVLVKEEELRCDDGKGSWRRKGTSILDHLLLDVAGIHVFRRPADFLKVLPPGWKGPSTNKELARDLKQPRFRIARMTYCLERMGVIRRVGKQGNAVLFERIEQIQPIGHIEGIGPAESPDEAVSTGPMGSAGGGLTAGRIQAATRADCRALSEANSKA